MIIYNVYGIVFGGSSCLGVYTSGRKAKVALWHEFKSFFNEQIEVENCTAETAEKELARIKGQIANADPDTSIITITYDEDPADPDGYMSYTIERMELNKP